MIEENINQEFRLKHIDEARKEQNKLMSKKRKNDTKLRLKEGKRQSNAFVSECKYKALIDLRNPFARYR